MFALYALSVSLLTLCAGAAVCSKPDTTMATTIDSLACLGAKNDIATPEYLFETVVTNVWFDASGTNRDDRTQSQYIERYRLLVDLNQDGHEDVIMSEPISLRGSGGLSYVVYLWTNGNYVCIGETGGHLERIRVEHIDDSTRIIWSYSHCSAGSGSIGTFVVRGWQCHDSRTCHIELSGDGQAQPTVGSQLLDIIDKTATVPIRIEKSQTKDGKVRWLPVDDRGR